MDAKQTMRQGRRLPLKHCLLPMAALLLTALAALLPIPLRQVNPCAYA